MEAGRKFMDLCRSLDEKDFARDVQEYIKTLGPIPIINQQLQPGQKMPAITDSILKTSRNNYKVTFNERYHSHYQLIQMYLTFTPSVKLAFSDPKYIFGVEMRKLKNMTEADLRQRIVTGLASAAQLGFKPAESYDTTKLFDLFSRLKTFFDESHDIIPMPDVRAMLTMADLQELAPAYDWMHFVGSHFPKRLRAQLNDQTTVRLRGSRKRFAELSKIWLDTDRLVLQDFLFLNYIRDLRVTYQTRKKNSCEDRFIEHFFKLAEHLTLKYLRKKEVVAQTKALTEKIRASFHDLFDSNTWLHDETKKYLKAQLDDQEADIGYNANAVDLRRIDEMYEMVPFPENANTLTLMLFEERADWFRNDVTIDDDFPNPTKMTLAMMTAWNNGFGITIPIGYLTAPYFDEDWPLEFQYALMGSTIGHEFTHSYDMEEELPQPSHGNDTWKFVEKTQCLVDQFNNVIYENPRLNLTVQVKGLG
ncbi:unnamed protein product, partial [Mesorhabditis spiculigera]